MNSRGNALLIVIILVLIVAGLGYVFYSRGYLSLPNQAPQYTPSTYNNYVAPSPTSVPGQESGNVTSQALALTVSSPKNGATLSSTSVTVTGKTSPNAEVFVNDQETKANAGGVFSLKITLDEGENQIVVVANDDLGNVSEVDLTVTVQSFQ